MVAQGSETRLTWWTSQNETDLLESVNAHINWLLERNAARRDWYHGFLGVYNGDMRTVSFPTIDLADNRRFLVFNDTRSVVETLHSKIAKQRPRPLFLSDGGSVEKQEQAQLLTKFVDAKFDELNVYRIGSRVVLDALIFGQGIVKVFANDDGECEVERVDPWMFFVGDADAADGFPSFAVQAVYYDRSELQEKFPDVDFSKTSGDISWFRNFVDDPHADKVVVWELWHVAHSKKAVHRHVVAVRDAILVDEECEFLPFAFVGYQPRPGSFWHSGVVENVFSLQLESNKLSSEISTAHHLLNKAKVLMPVNSGLPKSHVRNDIVVWEYDPKAGPPPQVVAWSPVAPDVYAYHATLRKAIYELSGQNQLGATGQKPSGLDSGAALREYSDIETERFGNFARALEAWYVDVADLLVRVQDSIGGNAKAKFAENDGFLQLSWREVKMPRDSYVIKCFPVSSLPQHPAGRLQTVQELMNSGLITDTVEARALLDFPDLDKSTDLAVAGRKIVDKMLERIISTGEYSPPEPLFDLQYCYIRGLEYYHYNRDKDVAPDRLELLRNWVTDVYNLINGVDNGVGSGIDGGEPGVGAGGIGGGPGAGAGTGGGGAPAPAELPGA